MENNLFVIGRNIYNDGSFDFKRFFMLLADKGYSIDNIVSIGGEDGIKSALSRFSSSNIIATGDTDELVKYVSQCGEDVSEKQFFKFESNNFILFPIYDEEYIKEIIIPVLNSRSKTFYNTVIFKVFGKTEHEIKELIKDHLFNRNKIVFDFYPSVLECEVHIRYSSFSSSASVNGIISGVGELLSPHCYAYSDISLMSQTAKQITASGRRISIAETFTGGALTAEITGLIPPALLCEGVVLSSEKSLTARMGISPAAIKQHGIVSDETAYMLAGKLLANPDCDIAVAVCGAGPETENEDRVFFTAVGDKNEIHVFAEHYFGSKSEIREAGIKHALYILLRFLSVQNSQANTVQNIQK